MEKKIIAGFKNIPEVLPDEMDIIDYLGFAVITSAICYVITKVTSD
ncbi:MAG: hypothetical protein HOG05_00795 [Bacteroidetes bacterium]|nr:hypothetical protein [Bacteroidota bacterium]